MFPIWQPRYAAHGIATFPVRIIERENGKTDKVPATKGYLRTGIRGSTALARKFVHADALGIACGQRNQLVVCDVDTTDENVSRGRLVPLRPDAAHHSHREPQVARWYRHNGERRQIRPDPNVPIDILGGGFVVAPPSRAGNGCYEIVQGSLDDLDKLPVMRGVPTSPSMEPVPDGRRNNELLRACRERAPQCHNEHEMLAFAMNWNRENCTPPDDDLDKVARTAMSAWKFELKRRNRTSQADLVMKLACEGEHVVGLYCVLRANNRPGNTFNVTNTMADAIGWNRKRLAHARDRLVELGHLELLRPAYRGSPAVFRWAPPAREETP